MERKELFALLKRRFDEILDEHDIRAENVTIRAKTLSPQEAIGDTIKKDYPILNGKEVMLEATYKGCHGQAFTDAPAAFEGSLSEVLSMDITGDPHERGIFIAVMNAVMGHLGLCEDNVHCRTEGPERCAEDMYAYLKKTYPHVKKIALIGYQPALLDMLSSSEFDVRVLDLNPANVGEVRYGIVVEDGKEAYQEAIDYADLILCTGSTVCNGTIVDYMGLDKEVVFFGTTLSGTAKLMGLKRVCFAHLYQ